MKTQQGGFTLIELVVVIVILGILAAVATPRFADLTDDAAQAVADGAFGAMASQAVILLAENSGTAATATTIAGEVQTAGDVSITASACNDIDINVNGTTYSAFADSTAYSLPTGTNGICQ